MLEKIYQQCLLEKQWQEDGSQLKLISILDVCKESLENDAKKSKFSVLAKLRAFANAKNQGDKKGIYLWGDVGRGKTMMMDLFYNNLHIDNKWRSHFHQFMANIHSQLQAIRTDKTKSNNKDPLLQIVMRLAGQYKVICLDELQINNIADAMLVGRIFTILLAQGVFVIFTSNRIPDDLFKDDLQYERLRPFINLINREMVVYNLNNYRDYRLEKLVDFAKVYYWPLNEVADGFIAETKQTLTGHSQWHEQELTIAPNRTLWALQTYGHIAHFTFNELCNTALGAEDYMWLCRHFSTIIISNIPQMHTDDYNQALRFITLIDCMYENKTKLICTAATRAEDLYLGTRNKFEFARTVSRLQEMQSHDYLAISLGMAA